MAKHFTVVSNTPETLNNANVLAALQKQGVPGCTVDVFDSLPSTSEFLSERAKQDQKTLIEGLAHADQQLRRALLAPQICVADWQTKGNGRRGKTWVTDRGNITFSLLIPMQKPPAQLLGLSLVTGICVVESLQHLANIPAVLKWPNDVLVEEQKLCGLLTELIPASDEVTQVIVGIGVNYSVPHHLEPAGYSATCLPLVSKSVPERSLLIADISARVLTAFDVFQAQGWQAFANRWNSVDFLKGKSVNVIDADGETPAIACGVNADGALIVDADGNQNAVYSGEVSVRLS